MRVRDPAKLELLSWKAGLCPDTVRCYARTKMTTSQDTHSIAQSPVADAGLATLLCDALPPQGAWSEGGYLWLTNQSRRLIEFTDGRLEELPVPTYTHQAILLFLNDIFRAAVHNFGGVVMVAPLRMRIREGKFREPDLLLLRDRNDPRCQDRYWLGADLVVEVVSPDDPDRDLVQKRGDYAEAGIPEYWIADPRDETILVLGLTDGAYRELGTYQRGDIARSPSLERLRVDVGAAFDAPK